jgi:hypothetical protein
VERRGVERRYCKRFSVVFCDFISVYFYPSRLLLLDLSRIVSFTSAIAICTPSTQPFLRLIVPFPAVGLHHLHVSVLFV